MAQIYVQFNIKTLIYQENYITIGGFNFTADTPTKIHMNRRTVALYALLRILLKVISNIHLLNEYKK